MKAQIMDKKATCELGTIDEKLTLVIRTSPDSVILTRVADGVFLEINQGFTNLTGHTYEDVIGKTSSEVRLWRNIEDRSRLVELLLKKGSVKNFEAQFLSKDGDIIFGVLSASLLNIDGEQLLLSITRDITEQKMTEIALKQRNEQLCLITDNMVDVISQTDAQANLIYISPSVERVYGYSQEEMIGQPAIGWIHRDDVERVVNQVSDARQKGLKSVLIEYRWRHAAGHYVWTESAARLLYDESGIAMGTVFASRDVTEKKSYEKQLIKFATVIDQVNVDILITDIHGTIQYINPFLEKNSGYSKSELIGKKPSIFKSGLHDNDFYKNLWTTILHKKTWQGQIQNRNKNGEILLYDMRITPLLDSKRNITAFVSIRRDITEQTRREQLQTQAQKMEAIGNLAAGISHDFNNILSALFGYSQLARNNLTKPEKAGKYIDRLTEGLKRATELVGQILTFSRKSSHEKQPLALYIVVKETLKLLRASIPASIKISEAIDSRATVMADPTKMHQILLNLCTNAQHSMNETGGVLVVGLKDIAFSEKDSVPDKKIKPGKYLRLEVSDTGHGMEKTILEKIFEPYFTTKTMDKGTGLGLAVVFGIVKEHDGHIRVYSEVGLGTTVHVYFPIIEKAAEPYIAREKTEDLLPGTERILLVDDEQAILKSTQHLLLALGYKVQTSPNGAAAYEKYKKNPGCFDLVITDMTMPGLSGFELSRKILELHPGQPIILCTGYSESIYREKSLALGIRHYYEKPITIKTLSKVIRSVLDEPVNKIHPCPF